MIKYGKLVQSDYQSNQEELWVMSERMNIPSLLEQ